MKRRAGKALLSAALFLCASGCGADSPSEADAREALRALLAQTIEDDWESAAWLRAADAERAAEEGKTEAAPTKPEVTIRFEAFDLLAVERDPDAPASEERWRGRAYVRVRLSVGPGYYLGRGVSKVLPSWGGQPGSFWEHEGERRFLLRPAPDAAPDADRWEIVAIDGNPVARPAKGEGGAP